MLVDGAKSLPASNPPTERRVRSRLAPPLAPFGHTLALVAVMLAVAISGSLLQHLGGPPAARIVDRDPLAARIESQYLPLLVVNAGLVLYVVRLFRPRSALPELLGRRWRTATEAFFDLLHASLAFVLICAIEVLSRPLFAGRNAAVSALLPSTGAERLTWLLVASVVGFCEEVVYRGYLQTQLGAMTRSPVLGLSLQAVLFGLAHLEQGPGAAVRIGVYGLILGLLARKRGSLLPGIVCHIGIDAMSAFLG